MKAALEDQEKSTTKGSETAEANDDLVIAIKSMQTEMADMKGLYQMSIKESKEKETRAKNRQMCLEGIVKGLHHKRHLSKQAFCDLNMDDFLCQVTHSINDLLVITTTFEGQLEPVQLLNGGVVTCQDVKHRTMQLGASLKELSQKLQELWNSLEAKVPA